MWDGIQVAEFWGGGSLALRVLPCTGAGGRSVKALAPLPLWGLDGPHIVTELRTTKPCQCCHLTSRSSLEVSRVTPLKQLYTSCRPGVGTEQTKPSQLPTEPEASDWPAMGPVLLS